MSGSEDLELKTNIVKSAQGMSLMSAMRMNRHERRATAKRSGVGKIIGSNKPYIKTR